MKTNVTTSHRFGIKAIVAVGLALVLAVGLTAISKAQADGSTVINETKAHIGADGKSYGAPFEGSDGTIEMPDMVRVRATNGYYGYISPNEMYAAILDYASTEEEKAASIKHTADLRTSALAEATNEFYGANLVSAEEVSECAAVLTTENGREKAREAMTETINQSLADQIEIDEADFDAIYAMAQAKCSVQIPVYDEDGMTVIGYYEVDRM